MVNSKRASGGWQKITSKYVLKNPWFKVRQDDVIRPDGKPATYNVVECSKSVFIIPVEVKTGNILLVRLFRYTTQHEGWEVPAGGVEDGETALGAAMRELQEETGCTSTSWKSLGVFDSMNGMSDAIADVFEAKELTHTGEHEKDEEGITEVRAFKPDEVIAMIKDGQIKDALSIAALAYYLFSKPAVIKQK